MKMSDPLTNIIFAQQQTQMSLQNQQLQLQHEQLRLQKLQEERAVKTLHKEALLNEDWEPILLYIVSNPAKIQSIMDFLRTCCSKNMFGLSAESVVPILEDSDSFSENINVLKGWCTEKNPKSRTKIIREFIDSGFVIPCSDVKEDWDFDGFFARNPAYLSEIVTSFLDSCDAGRDGLTVKDRPLLTEAYSEYGHVKKLNLLKKWAKGVSSVRIPLVRSWITKRNAH